VPVRREPDRQQRELTVDQLLHGLLTSMHVSLCPCTPLPKLTAHDLLVTRLVPVHGPLDGLRRWEVSEMRENPQAPEGAGGWEEGGSVPVIPSPVIASVYQAAPRGARQRACLAPLNTAWKGQVLPDEEMTRTSARGMARPDAFFARSLCTSHFFKVPRRQKRGQRRKTCNNRVQQHPRAENMTCEGRRDHR